MGKNVKKVISLVLVFAMILTGMTFTGFDAKAADAANDTSAVTDLMSCHQTAHTNCHRIA